MVLNYVKEQISLGQLEARKFYGKLNNADLHMTKPIRSSSFQHKAHKILGQPAPILTSPPTFLFDAIISDPALNGKSATE
jgi:hypothetical protein